MAGNLRPGLADPFAPPPGAPANAPPPGAGGPGLPEQPPWPAAPGGPGGAPPAGPAVEAPPPLVGLAADLAGTPEHPAAAPGAYSGPAGGGPPARLPPARLGAAPRWGRSAAPPPPPPPQPLDPFAVLRETQRAAHAQQLAQRPGPDGEAPYGLALDLLHDRDPNAHAFPDPPPQPPPRRLGSAAPPPVARLGSAPQPPAPQPPTHPPLDPFTVMELAASQEGLPEPDYGLVAELRNRMPPDPFAEDFGLVAEVARRRGRSRSPLGRSSGGGAAGGTAGGAAGRPGALPPLRARRRLDPVVPPQWEAEANLAAQVAARKAAEAEPFGAAAAAGGAPDPFAAADEQLRVPQELMDPYEEPQQAYPAEGDVPVVAPSEGGAQGPGGQVLGLGVAGDEELYGIARDLGVSLETAARIRQERVARGELPGQPGVPEPTELPEPQGAKYVYDEDTGMLITTEGNAGEGGRVAREYIEDDVTGAFYKLHSRKQRLFAWFRRKGQGLMEDEDEEEEEKGFRGGLRRTLRITTNVFNVLGLFAQGLLGGFALLNFFLTYMVYSSDGLREFLFYYSKISLSANRLYYTLLCLAIIGCTSRLTRDQLRHFEPRRLWLAAVDGVALLCYLGAYICTVLATPLDDELYYEYNRNPRYWQLTWSSTFKKRFNLWNLLNLIRTLLSGLAWALACYQVSPYVFDATLRLEVRRAVRQAEHDAARGAARLGMLAAAAAGAGGPQDGGGGGVSGDGGGASQRKTA